MDTKYARCRSEAQTVTQIIFDPDYGYCFEPDKTTIDELYDEEVEREKLIATLSAKIKLYSEFHR